MNNAPFLSAEFFAPFSPDDPLVLALSGGMDSVFLGEMLFRAGFRNVTVAHFDHALRKESSEDQIFCSQKAQNWKWKYATERWQQPVASEEKARTARYAFLEQVRAASNSRAILLAQHVDDQEETIFFQFLRGTGVKGLKGMERWDERRQLFRPLLALSKAEIRNFLEQEEIAWCEDHTNADPEHFDRNYLRLIIFPLLEERFPHFRTALKTNADVMRQVDVFLQKEAEKAAQDLLIPTPNHGWQFSRVAFAAFPEILRGEILRRIFAPQVPTFAQIQDLSSFLQSGLSGKKKMLCGVSFLIYGDNIFVEKAEHFSV